MKAAWELMEIFYADKQSQYWIPEQLVDWLAVSFFFLFFSLSLSHWCILTLLFFLRHLRFCQINNCISQQVFDSLFTGAQPTVHSKLVDFQIELVTLQVWPCPDVTSYLLPRVFIKKETRLLWQFFPTLNLMDVLYWKRLYWFSVYMNFKWRFLFLSSFSSSSN